MNEMTEREYDRVAEGLERRLQEWYPFPEWHVARAREAKEEFKERAALVGESILRLFWVDVWLWIGQVKRQINPLALTYSMFVTPELAQSPDAVKLIGNMVARGFGEKLLSSGPAVSKSTPGGASDE